MPVHSSNTNRRVRRGAIGILCRGTELLVIRRAAGIAKGGSWCFPGGHVEPGETSRQAVRRELAEELGLVVEPTERLGSVRVLDSRYILAVWRVECERLAMKIASDEVAEVRWVTADVLRSMTPGLPSNDKVLAMLGA